MSGKNINFDDKKIKKSAFYKNKKLFQIDDIDINKILVSEKEPYCTKNALKYFLGYNDNDVIRRLCLRLLQMTGYTRKFNENTTMSLRVNNKQLLKNYDKIWKKVEKLLNIDFESKPVHGNDDDKYIKTKIYAGSAITNFHNKKVLKEKTPCKSLSIIMLDSVIKPNKNYYPQALSEECKYAQEKIKTKNYIDDDLKSDSDSNDEKEYDIDNDDDK